MRVKEKSNILLGTMLTTVCVLSGCDGDRGLVGQDGVNGAQGLQSLISQTVLSNGNEQCFDGGVRVDSGLDVDRSGVLELGEVTATSVICAPTSVNEAMNFNRVASFLVCSQIDAGCNTDTETAAEIVAASSDGMTLIYSDSPAKQIGFVDISEPANPVADGVLNLSGEPTSVAVKDNYALIAINTSADFVNVSGQLDIVDLISKTLVNSLDLGGQPDSIAVSPDGQYAAIVIENQRDEDLGDGMPLQAPAGFLVIADLSGPVSEWKTSRIALTGLADLYADDPEPEFVDINSNNIAVVTLQENNHLVLIDLASGLVTNDFSAGSVNLSKIDRTEEDALIEQTESLDAVLNEPDGVAWINTTHFVTADEGDLNGGSRGFTVFNTSGEAVWNAGNSLDLMTARLGHYPDDRSGNKGNEPENAEVGVFGDDRYLFINSERSSLIFVYDIADPTNPVFKQALPAAAGPEGGLAIPSRNLLVVASEADDRGDKLRSTINIYFYGNQDANYPTLQANDRFDGTPIPWAAISGLAVDPWDEDVVYAVEDSFFLKNRIFTIDVSQSPARLVEETRILDTNNVFAGISRVALTNDSADADDIERVDVFDDADLAAMINDDNTVNIDPEGIARASDGGFWVASEGSGSVGDTRRPVNSLNFIFKTNGAGVIEDVITLPESLNNNQLRFGFEGIAEYEGKVYVAFQRVWPGDSNLRIGIYDPVNRNWGFLFYTLDAPESQNGGWVGLSDLTPLGNGEFLVIERDNQAGPDAAIKRLYRFNISGLVENSVVSKTLVRDLIPDLTAPGGLTVEKVEGSAFLANGDLLIVNDNDGVDDNSGETLLLNLGKVLNN